MSESDRYGIVHDDGERNITQERWRLDADDTLRLRESELQALLEYERALTISEMGRDVVVEMIPDDPTEDGDTQ